MNCANHPDRERAAFCQSCGKPLCTECTRNVGTSLFCEPCLAARVAGTTLPAGFGYSGPAGYSAGPAYPPVAPSGPSEPNPVLAAILGFIPGVGAMYNEQYAKGIVHLIVFAILVSLADANNIFGLFVAGWIFYMVIEAHHTARARRDGTPLPNPFGLNDLSERLGFGRAWPGGAPPVAPNPGPAAPAPDAPASAYTPPYSYPYVGPVSHWGAPQDAYSVPPVTPVSPMPPYPDPALTHRRFPAGAVWLILLGVFFLLANTGIFHIFHTRLFGPLLLIGVGVWLFVRRMTCDGHGIENDGSPDYRWRLSGAVNSSIWVVLTGVIWLLDVLHILSWSRGWPIYLIAGGVVMLLRRTLDYGPGSYTGPGSGYARPVPPAGPPAVPVASTEIVVRPPTPGTSGDGQEGR
jgi:hypothetical protein